MKITPQELRQIGDGCIIIDIRDDYSRSYGTIKNAISVKPDDLQNSPYISSGKTIILCDSNGKIAHDYAQKLIEKGIDARYIDGGYTAWLLDKMEEQKKTSICADVEKSIQKRYKKRIWNYFTKAIRTYDLVQEGDCIGVCISGGKDSMLMAKLFNELKRHDKFPFEVKYILMDPGYSESNRKVIENNAEMLNIPLNIFKSDIFDSVYNVEKSPCYLCARMRRGNLYSFAKSLGCNKIALGHHYDDVIETILMGMLYGAQIQTMMPKLRSTNFEGMELIRPMYLIREKDIIAWRDSNDLHFLQCACRFTENSVSLSNEENESKRMEIKQLIKTLKKTNPDVEAHIFRSVENVNLDTVIAYKKGDKKVSFLDWYDK